MRLVHMWGRAVWAGVDERQHSPAGACAQPCCRACLCSPPACARCLSCVCVRAGPHRYEYLAKPEFQGCGHVRLMLYKHKEYGLPSAFIAEELIRQFFAFWWPTPLGSPQRAKVDFVVKRGPLAGKAVAVVVNEGPACTDQTPLSMAAHGGSSVFVYHQGAVADFRAKVLAPLLAGVAADSAFWGTRVSFDQAKFIKGGDALASTQLGYTLNNLSPADQVRHNLSPSCS